MWTYLKTEWIECFIYNENVNEVGGRKMYWKKRQVKHVLLRFRPSSQMWRADCFPVSEWAEIKPDGSYMG